MGIPARTSIYTPTPRTKMKTNRTNCTPLTSALSETGNLTDNLLAEATLELSLFRFIGITKRSGDPAKNVVFSILLWPLLSVDSINCFCGKFIKVYLKGGLDTIYNFLKREDINWRSIRMSTAKQVYKKNQLGNESLRVFIADDSVKKRKGRKVEGTSSHFEHTECRHVMGQQVLELGYATPKGFISLDSQIFVGDKKVQPVQKPFKDGNSAVARDYKCAIEKNKNEMLLEMLSRAQRKGFKADYLLTDAWFGTKGNLQGARKRKLKTITMMKRGKLKYRMNEHVYTALELHAFVKRRMKAKKGQRFRTYMLRVEIDTSTDKKVVDWREVKLIFSAPKRANKHSWVVLLSTDLTLSTEDILKIYSLRWGIEVYFKEAKQNFGFLKEQTGKYVCHYASVHLTAIRYLLFYHMMLSRDALSFGEIRNSVTKKLELLSFAGLLWELFRSLISGVLEQFKDKIGSKLLSSIMSAIGSCIESFLFEALQIDAKSLDAQIRSEKMGVI